MNTTPDNPQNDDLRQFDLLVDDELSEKQRRRLLSSLDDEPGGWRRCALAFLEAQSWKKELRTYLREPSGPTDRAKPSIGGKGHRIRLSRHVPSVLAVAASFLLALTAVWWLQGMWRPGDVATSPAINAIAQNEELPAGQPVEPRAIEPKPPRLPQASSSPWRMVALGGADDAQGAGLVRVPAVERDRLDTAGLSNLPTAMPDDIRRALEQSGHQVRQRRELVPFEMQDGRRLVVPVDQVDVQYVGNPPL